MLYADNFVILEDSVEQNKTMKDKPKVPRSQGEFGQYKDSVQLQEHEHSERHCKMVMSLGGGTDVVTRVTTSLNGRPLSHFNILEVLF